MGKNKCERELEEMTAERDHWRRTAQERKREAVELRSSLELTHVDMRAIGAGVAGAIQEYRVSLATMQHQRDASQKRLTDLVEWFYDGAQEEYTNVVPRLQEEIEQIKQLSQEGQLTYLSTMLIDAGVEVYTSYEGHYEAGIDEASRRMDIDVSNMKDYPEFRVLQARRLYDRVANLELAWHLVLRGMGTARPVGLVAQQLLTECRVNNKPRMQTVEWLDIQWIAENLPDPPDTHRKLSEGIVWANRLKLSGESIERFADLHAGPTDGMDASPAEKTLRRYIKWYEKLESTSRAPKLTGKLPATVQKAK